MIYFTSDLHLGHVNIIKYCQRPFPATPEGRDLCDRFIIDRYNETVNENDYVFILGDVALCNSKKRDHYIKLIKSLHGHRILIQGNHDTHSIAFYQECGFLQITDSLRFGEYFLCHYAFAPDFHPETKEQEPRLKEKFLSSGCKILIHGHTHDFQIAENDGINRINVCVDHPANQFRPIQIPGIPEQEIIKHFQNLLP